MRLPALAFLLTVLAPALPALAQSPGDALPRDSIAARLAELNRIHTPEGIEVLEPVEVNGSTQWISIRGLNRGNPILLFVHGGPASPMLGMSWAYQKPWEDFFTVVNWDQRGVGKNYSAADTARIGPTMDRRATTSDEEWLVAHIVLERLDIRTASSSMGYYLGHGVHSRLVIGPLTDLFQPGWSGVVAPGRGADGGAGCRVLEAGPAVQWTPPASGVEANGALIRTKGPFSVTARWRCATGCECTTEAGTGSGIWTLYSPETTWASLHGSRSWPGLDRGAIGGPRASPPPASPPWNARAPSAFPSRWSS